jgi:monoterpene epsilon-lactone hydrolase
VLRLWLVDMFLRLTMKGLWRGSPSVTNVRRRFAWADFLGAVGGRHCSIRRAVIDGVPVEWIGDQAAAASGVILYLHGGAFVLRGARTDRKFCADLARRAGLPVALVAYRLAPEFPFPAGLDDCGRVFAGLQAQGHPASRIVLLGHSAGANFILATMMRMRLRGQEQPAGAVLLSPPTDLTRSATSTQNNAHRDCMLTPAIWPWVRQFYLGGASADNPDASPLFGDWSGLAPMQFHVSDSELLLHDNLRAVELARQAGASADLTIWAGVPHSFAHIDFLLEAARVRNQIVAFARRVLLDASAPAAELAMTTTAPVKSSAPLSVSQGTPAG